MTAIEGASQVPSAPGHPQGVPGPLDEGKLSSGLMSWCRNNTNELCLLC